MTRQDYVEIVNATRASMLTMVTRLLWPREIFQDDIDDLMAGAIADVWRDLNSKHPPSEDNIGGYLIAAIRNDTLNYIRDQREAISIDALAEENEEGRGVPVDSILGEAPVSDATTDVHLALAKLSPAERQLADWLMEGLTCREMGQKLGVSYETASKRTQRVAAKLRALLSDYAGKGLPSGADSRYGGNTRTVVRQVEPTYYDQEQETPDIDYEP